MAVPGSFVGCLLAASSASQTAEPTGIRALYTQDQVFDTADRLAAEGKDVTATNLLSELGGGSLTTILQAPDRLRHGGGVVHGRLKYTRSGLAAPG